MKWNFWRILESNGLLTVITTNRIDSPRFHHEGTFQGSKREFCSFCSFVAVTTGTWCIICEEFVSSRLVGPNIIGPSIFRHYICFLVKIGIISSVIIDCNTHRMQTKIGKKSSYTFSMFIFLFFFCFIKIFIIITNVQCKTNSSSLK